MFTQEAINQALSLWLGSAAVGLVISLIIAFFSTRKKPAGQAHDHGGGHNHEETQDKHH